MNKSKTKFIFIDANFILNLVIIFCVSFIITKVVKKNWFKKDSSSVAIKSSSLDGGIHISTKGKYKNNIFLIDESMMKIKGNNVIVDGLDYGEIPDNVDLMIKDGKVFISGKEASPLE